MTKATKNALKITLVIAACVALLVIMDHWV